MRLCVLLNSTVSWVVSHASSIAYDRMPANVLAPLCDNGTALQARTSSSSSSSSGSCTAVSHKHTFGQAHRQRTAAAAAAAAARAGLLRVARDMAPSPMECDPSMGGVGHRKEGEMRGSLRAHTAHRKPFSVRHSALTKNGASEMRFRS